MKSILTAEHRPWPLPRTPWLMTQTWHDLLFAHWPVPCEAVQSLLPPGVDVDTCDGRAWLGVVAFRLSAIRLHGLPEIPMLSGFPEVNVRTYVTSGGTPGVYFLSLDADNPLVATIARPWFHLAYHKAQIDMVWARGLINFASRRNRAARGGPAAEIRVSYTPCSAPFSAAPGTLEHWLTERYCYYAVDRRARTFRCEIRHPPWLLQTATAMIRENTMVLASGVDLPQRPPLLHYSPLMKALIWQPARLTRAPVQSE
jgi:uncharacterized protein YqjF (DUF2071 family)